MFKKSAAPAAGGYTLSKSLRFRSSASAYLSRTPGSASNRTTWTWSGWVKRGTLNTTTGYIFGAYTDASNFMGLRFGATLGGGSPTADGLNVVFVSGAADVARVDTAQVFRDPSAWYHIVYALDTTQATASNRVKLYVNGTQITAFSSATYPSQNSTWFINNTVAQGIGAVPTLGQYFDGYIAELNFVDGQALTPSSFGSNSGTGGVWQPAKYTGTYGTNGFYLKFTDTTSTTTLCYDYSGNSNNWTPNNISLTAGTTYDSMTDVPTLTSATVANYCVLNPLDLDGGFTFADGNLKITATASARTRATFGLSSGKWYWETKVNDVSVGGQLGVLSSSGILSGYTDLGTQSFGWGLFTTADARSGQKQNNNTTSNYGGTVTTGDVVMCALDMDTGSIYWGKNGSWANGSGSWNQSTPNNAAFTNLSGYTVSPAYAQGGGTSISWSANFGQQPFSYTVPTGYKAVNTYNLTTPTIAAGNQYMDATLYTGNGSTQSITNAGSFKPDFVWYKSRVSGFYNHGLFDSVRGTTKQLFSNTTGAEATFSGVTAFNSNGFSLGSDAGGNNNTDNYVAWQWQAGQGSTSSNTNGSITSNVSVSTTNGFSVVTFTVPGSGTSATIGHGLGAVPQFIITKSRTQTFNWATYHVSLGNGNRVLLNTTDASAATTAWNSTTPTTSVFTIGSSVFGNDQMVAYCWTPIAGYSAFGSYTGNGSTDGPFVYTGFRPKFVLIKNTNDGGAYWNITDSVRGSYNVDSASLYPNATDAEGTSGVGFDFLSNGFKVRNAATFLNTNGQTMIYAAFAENPFKYALAR